MDGEVVTTTADSGPAWYEVLIGDVVRAAAMKKYATPQLQNGQSYYVDNYGNVVPTGQVVPGQGQVANALAANPLVMLAALALTGVLLYKLVK
ncbi:MAG TPA: hypothetical protein VEC35_23400 [Noviherbaspirillum sp.]|nr:hypothetical protein [Noviherbaspirillum sp.]